MTYWQLAKTYPRPLLFGFMNGFFSFHGQTHFVSLFSPFLISLFALSNTQYGLMYSLATLLSGFVLPFVGPLIDKTDVRFFCLFLGLGMIVSELALAWAPNLTTVFLILFALRLFGQGLMSQVQGVVVARYFEANRGKALSLSVLGMPLAEGAITPLFAYFLGIIHWQNVCLILAISVLVIYLPAVLLLTRGLENFNNPAHGEPPDRMTGEKLARKPTKSWTRGEVFKHSTVYLLIPHSMVPPFTLTGVLFHQGVIANMKGWSLAQIALGLTFFAITRSVVSFLIGPMVDRYGAHKLFIYYLIPSIFGFALLAIGQSTLFIYLSFALFGITVGGGATIKSALWAELFGIGHLGAIKSTLGTIAVVSTAIAPALFGYVLDFRQESQSLLLSLSALSLLTTLTAWRHLTVGPGSKLLPAAQRKL